MANTIAPLVKRQGRFLNCTEMMGLCGLNTGNVCFVDAMYQQLYYEREILCTEIDADNQEDAVYVLPASNWINNDGRVLRQIFLPLEKANIKLAVLGLGVQMELNQKADDFIKELSKETIAALKIMSEHSVSIGVRGVKQEMFLIDCQFIIGKLLDVHPITNIIGRLERFL